jgi:hypothetical protein
VTEMTHYLSDPNIWAEQVVARFINQSKRHLYTGVLIADICGTLIDADHGFHKYYAAEAARLGFAAEDIASLDTFRALGHRAHLGHPDITTDYEALKERLMHDSDLHIDMPPMQNSLNMAQRGAEHGLPHGYLSTRPDAIGEATHHNLQSHGFVDAPMLLRDEATPYAGTISYKLRALGVLRATLDAHRLRDLRVVFVDDYAQLIQSVNESDMAVVGVHFDAATSWGKIAHDYLGIPNF